MKTLKILGVDFSLEGPQLPDRVLEAGLVVAPSGPGLANDLRESAAYREALRNADWVIPDSGLMVLVWNALHFGRPERRIQRYSGLRLLREILPREDIRTTGATFWIMPSVEERDRNLQWLISHGHDSLTEQDCYLAPVYRPDEHGRVEDPDLLAVIEARRPKVIFVNVGGGVQEQLGWYLRSRLSYRPTILCTGAAIAFLSGGQTAISPWADRFYLGWLLRIRSSPSKFGLRYGKSLGLVRLICQFRDRAPVPDGGKQPDG